MKEQLCYQQSHLDKVMTTEQFNQIVDAAGANFRHPAVSPYEPIVW